MVYPKSRSKGFTLIEVSIVIILIGLIAASVVGGQALVQQAKLRQVVAHYSEITTAIRAFKMEYNAVPGDMRNASSYWPGAPDGNGNNEISEAANFWDHLSRAGLFNQATDGTGTMLPGPFNATFFRPAIHYAPPAFGRRKTSYNFNGDGHSWGGAVSANQAYNIDMKMDDGLANTTNNKSFLSTARAYNQAGPDVCTQGNIGYSSAVEQLYQLSDEGENSCWMFFWLEDVIY